VTAAQASEERALSVSDVRNLLRQAVLRTELKPGSVYSQDEVRTSLDVGRTPFREALRMVQAEGLIEISPNGRLRIPELTVDGYTQIQIGRIALESAAARLAVPQLGPDDLARLEGYMGQMSHYLSTDHFDRIETPHQGFHQGLVAGAGPAILERINDLGDRASRYRWAFSEHLRDHWDIRTLEHRAILDAAIAGDGEQVAILLSSHYLDAGLLLAETIDDPDGRERFKQQTLASLAPTVRSAVEGPKAKPRRSARGKGKG
jgi:DNA-binding GntR family transcriptional regulator